MANIFIARIREIDKSRQNLSDHLFAVAELAEQFSSKINLTSSGRLIGLTHDLGKYSKSFQNYIQNGNGIRGEVDHATAGAQKIWNTLGSIDNKFNLLAAQILATCVAYHHGQLPDYISPEGDPIFNQRMQKSDEKTNAIEVEKNCEHSIKQEIHEILSSSKISNEFKTCFKKIVQFEGNETLRHFHFGLIIRFLYSCLIDADRLNSANYDKPHLIPFRTKNIKIDWEYYVKKLNNHLAKFKIKNNIDELRNLISQECFNASSRPKGIFTLGVPTGGGKTLGSLRFALQHAKHHSLLDSKSAFERIIYITPYTSIIDQNAETVRNILGDNAVLEHHSNLVPEKDTYKNRILSENWNAPIVFTTSVQFLNSLFAGPTSDVRRMHQLANSIIIFDEIQTIPIKTIHLFNNAINFLIQTCGSSIVFCTATQPLLDEVNPDLGSVRLNSNSAIMSDVHKLFVNLRRTAIKNLCKISGWSDREVADLSVELLNKNGSVLIIVNTKSSALNLYKMLCNNAIAKVYHLSTNMCPAHRKEILSKMRNNLDNSSQPIICISTQLIEAGVDIDFGSVIRYLAGLDSIAQAAGRCNRNGRNKDLAPVIVVNSMDENLDNLNEIKEGQSVTIRIFDEFRKNPELFDNDLLSPTAMKRFYQYYFYNRSFEMTYPVNSKNNPKIKCDTDLVELLSQNKIFVESYKNKTGIKPQFPLRQAFRSASNEFQVIDAPTTGIIVPYGEIGKKIIAELVTAFTNQKYSIEIQLALLRKSQQFTVNVFPNLLDTLSRKGCIFEISNEGIYYLDEKHYNDAFGISLEETMKMTFLNL